MSRDGGITMQWADGHYKFCLQMGGLRELAEKTKGSGPETGPRANLKRLVNETWRVDDIRETIRLGLIGGGMSPTDAHKLTVRYVDERPLMENVQPAVAILMEALMGVPDEIVGKAEPEEADSLVTTTSH